MPYVHAENRVVNKKHITPTPVELILQWEKHDQQVKRMMFSKSHCGGNVGEDVGGGRLLV